MYNTKESIQENPFLNDLVNEAARFGIYGAYINYQTAINPQNNGIYFICGYNRNDVLNKENNIEEMYEKQNNSKTFRADIHIAKITDQSPFNTHQDVMRYCLHSSTLKAICKKYGFNKQINIASTQFIKLVEMFYLNANDSRQHTLERKRCELILHDFLEIEGEKEIALNGETGEGHKIHMRPEKLDKNCPNMVSLEDLTYKTFGTKQVAIPLEMLNEFKYALNRHPEILYFQAKPVVAKLAMANNQGFGSEEKNTLSSVMFLYDAQYHKEMELIYLRIKYPQCFLHSVKEIKSKGENNGICSFGLSIDLLESVFKKANENNIPICLDVDKLYFSYDKNVNPDTNIAGYTIVIPKNNIYIAQMKNILINEAVRAKDKHILTNEDIRKYILN